MNHPKQTATILLNRSLEYASSEGMNVIISLIPTNQLYLLLLMFFYSFLTPGLLIFIIPLVIFIITFLTLIIASLQVSLYILLLQVFDILIFFFIFLLCHLFFFFCPSFCKSYSAIYFYFFVLLSASLLQVLGFCLLLCLSMFQS